MITGVSLLGGLSVGCSLEDEPVFDEDESPEFVFVVSDPSLEDDASLVEWTI